MRQAGGRRGRRQEAAVGGKKLQRGDARGGEGEVLLEVVSVLPAARRTPAHLYPEYGRAGGDIQLQPI